MTTCSTNSCHVTASRTTRLSVVDRVLLALAVRRQRSKLANLDGHLLRDIGLTREKAAREAKRKPWDVPQHWLR
jgi:uncharacterized protein YjiS (DUF1127 family)